MPHYCFVSAQYLPTMGGVERYTLELGKELLRQGQRVSVITGALPNLPLFEIDENGIEIHRIPSWLLLNGRLPTPKFGKALSKVLDKFGSAQDLRIVVQTRFYPLALQAARQSRRRKIPFIIIEHGSSHLNMGSAFANVFSGWYEHFAVWLCKQNGANFYAVSAAGAEWLSHFKIECKGVLYNAVNIADVQAKADKGCDVLETLGLDVALPLVVYAGRLVPEKGVWELLEAFKAVNAQGQQAVLVMAGEGSLAEALAEQGGKGVVICGMLSQEKLFALIKAASIFCLPSVSEGMPTSVLEAVALGCFVITTARGGAKELLLDESYGTVLANNEPVALAHALNLALSQPEACRMAAKKAQERLAQEFTFVSTVKALQKLEWRTPK